MSTRYLVYRRREPRPLPRFVNRFGTLLFIGFLTVGVVLLLLVHSVFNGGFRESLRFAALPLAVIIFGYVLYFRDDLAELNKSSSKAWVSAVLLYLISLLMVWPWFMGLNAVTATGESVTYHGPVILKFKTGGRFPSQQAVIRDGQSGKEITLPISERRYADLEIGSQLEETYQIGGFGIPYRWRNSRRSSPSFP